MIDIQINRFAVNINSGVCYRSFPRRLANRELMVDFIIGEVRREYVETVRKHCRVDRYGMYDLHFYFEGLVVAKHTRRLQDLQVHFRNHMFCLSEPEHRVIEHAICDRFAAEVGGYIASMDELEPKKARIRMPEPAQLSLF